MTTLATITYFVEADGVMERHEDALPWLSHVSALSVRVPATASSQATARLLRRLADELEGCSL